MEPNPSLISVDPRVPLAAERTFLAWIRTGLALGDRVWPVEFTLACRKSMRYRLLLGSKALIDGQLVVNPALKYIQDKPEFPVTTTSATGVA